MNNKINTLPLPNRLVVPLAKLEIDEDTFQPRSGNTNAKHVSDLVEVLARGVELDPLLVWEDPDTGRYIVGDGHHRLEAYTQVAWSKPILIDVFKCDLATAKQLSVVENSKKRLNLHDSESRNFGWQRVVDGVWTKRRIIELCGVSEGTVKNMRRAKRELLKRGEELPDTWNAARRLAAGNDPDVYDDAEAMRVAIARAKDKFGDELTKLIQRWPEATGELISKCAGDHLRKALAPLGYHETDPYGTPLEISDVTPF